jgi:hypothetical protein
MCFEMIILNHCSVVAGGVPVFSKVFSTFGETFVLSFYSGKRTIETRDAVIATGLRVY